MKADRPELEAWGRVWEGGGNGGNIRQGIGRCIDIVAGDYVLVTGARDREPD